MPHPTHKLKAYTGEVRKPLVFCAACGREESEGLDDPCTEKFYVREVQAVDTSKPKFYSGLPFDT